MTARFGLDFEETEGRHAATEFGLSEQIENLYRFEPAPNGLIHIWVARRIYSLAVREAEGWKFVSDITISGKS